MEKIVVRSLVSWMIMHLQNLLKDEDQLAKGFDHIIQVAKRRAQRANGKG